MERVFRLPRGSRELRTEERNMKETKNKTNETTVYLPLSREREKQVGIFPGKNKKSKTTKAQRVIS